MSVSDVSDAAYVRAARCIHEAAHAVMATLAGARVEKCAVTADGGRVEFSGAARHHTAIGWAGAYAELLWACGGEPTEAEVRAALANLSDEDRALTGGRRARHIEPDIRHAMPAIRRLAVKLSERGSVRSPDVLVALGVGQGRDLDMVRWAHRQRIDPTTIRPAGFRRGAA